MSHPVKTPKKLIEVALPLDAINVASAREKSIRHGHPSTLHLWWARRPLATARAVIFGQMVNDPSWKWELEHPGEIPPSNIKASWAAGRKRLFGIIEELVKWENTTNEEVLEKARAEIRKSWRETCELNKEHPQAAELFNPDKLPAFHDPFAGGGAIPLEAQRLGLEAHASDLNPVAVLINKAMIEIPARFAGRPPVNPRAQAELAKGAKWNARAAEGLAEDVRYYGEWMRDEAKRRIGHFYPKVQVTPDMAKERPDLKSYVGKELTVIAWIWARTVKSPNPAFSHVDVPLASTFMLANKGGGEAYVQLKKSGDSFRFTVAIGKPHDPEEAINGTKLSRGANFKCAMSGVPIDPNYIKDEGAAGRMGARLMAIVVEGDRGRVYLAPNREQEIIAKGALPTWKPEAALPDDPRNFWTVRYGLTNYGELFTSRQLVALTTFSDLVAEAMEAVKRDTIRAGLSNDGKRLSEDGSGAIAYAEGIATYLALIVSRSADRHNTICTWDIGPTNARSSTGSPARSASIRNAFSRQSLPMTWDYAEGNPFSDSATNILDAANWIAKVLERIRPSAGGDAVQMDAGRANINGSVVSTDPPYYDNIGYADLSDFFYVWLRRSLRPFFPELFSTIAVPKAEELVATPYRHGSKDKAEAFFLDGMTTAMHRLAEHAHPAFPVTIYYAYKQSETGLAEGTSSTGWETFLDAVMRAGFAITGTWPMRTELSNRMIGSGTNALASSVVLVCRPRLGSAETVSRRTFIRELNQVLPEALDEMTKGSGESRSPVAPVDLSQAIIGPGMAVFSKYSAVLEADGSAMTVQAANRLINRFLAEDDFDADTQFCLHWFDQFGWKEGKFGDADTLARAKGTAVDGVRDAGVIAAGGGIVRLLKWAEYDADWHPHSDSRLPIWEALHQLIRVFHANGESSAGEVLAAIAPKAEAMRQLAYRLYTLCERSGRAEDARAYNEIITSWSAIESAASNAAGPAQRTFFDD